MTTSTSQGVGLVTSGLEWEFGDEILTTTEEHPGLLGPLDTLRHRLEVVDRVGEREAEARADANRGEGGVLLARRVEEVERRRPDDSERRPRRVRTARGGWPASRCRP